MVTLSLLLVLGLSVLPVVFGAMLVRESIRARRFHQAESASGAVSNYPGWAVVLAWVLGVQFALVGAGSALVALWALAVWVMIPFGGG